MKRLLKPNEYWYILDKHWYDFERESQLLDMLNQFLDEKLAKSHTKVAKWCHHIRSVVDRSKKSQNVAAQFDALSIINGPIGRPLSSITKINDGPEEFDLLAVSFLSILMIYLIGLIEWNNVLINIKIVQLLLKKYVNNWMIYMIFNMKFNQMNPEFMKYLMQHNH